MKKSLLLIMTSVLVLSGCGQGYKELKNAGDPGRVTELKNTEIIVRSIGNTTVNYVGDTATQSCVAITERSSLFWTNSVAITAMPPEACGYPAKETKVSVVVQQKAPTIPVPQKPVPHPLVLCPAVCTAVTK